MRAKITCWFWNRYAIFLHDLYYPKSVLAAPRIPMPFVGYIATFNPAPATSATTSIISIYATVYTFIRASRLKPTEVFWAIPAQGRGIDKINIIPALIAGAFASVAPVLALYDSASVIEIFFWCIPILVEVMCISAIRMMLQVEGKLEALDKARYRFKGAWSTIQEDMVYSMGCCLSCTYCSYD